MDIRSDHEVKEDFLLEISFEKVLRIIIYSSKIIDRTHVPDAYRSQFFIEKKY